MEKLKKILLAVSVLLSISAISVTAQENTSDILQEGIKKGSVRIVLTEENESTKKENVGFQCVKVADIVNGEYVFTEEFRQSGIDINSIQTAEKLDEAAKILAEQNLDGETKLTGADSTVTFAELEIGLYLLKATDTADYGMISPALIAVPTWNEVKKTMEYNVTVIPKHTEEVLKTVKTGDHGNTYMYIILAGGSLLCIYCLGGRRRKHV